MPENRTKQKPTKSRHILSVPLTPVQKATLQKLAGREHLSAYARAQIFAANDNSPAKTRKTRNRTPVKDQTALADALAKLGRSETASSLREIVQLARLGALPLAEETEIAILRACRDIAEIKSILFNALGLQER